MDEIPIAEDAIQFEDPMQPQIPTPPPISIVIHPPTQVNRVSLDEQLNSEPTTPMESPRTPHSPVPIPPPLPPHGHNFYRKSERKPVGIPRVFWNYWGVVILGLSFLFIFSSYNTTQGYMTTIYKSNGYIILGIIYFIFGVTNFLSPIAVSYFGPKLVIVVASGTYAIFVLSCGSDLWYVVCIFAAFQGIGSSVLWTAQADYLSRIAGSDIGLFSGIFYGFFWSSLVIGYLIGGILLSAQLELWITFLILFVFSFIGSFLLLFLSRPPDAPKRELSKVHLFLAIKNSFMILYEKKIWFLILFSFHVGYNRAVYNGKIPEVVSTLLYPKYVGYTMTTLGVGEIVGSLFFGKACDKFGIFWITIGAMLFTFGACASSMVMQYEMPYFFFITAILTGFADGGMTVCLMALMGTLFKGNIASAFATKQLIESLGTVVGLAIAYFETSLLVLQIISVSILSAAIVSFVFFDTFIEEVDQNPRKLVN
jgi:MFS family permease